MDPTSVAVIAGAAGGASGKIVEKVWELGQWLGTYAREYQPAAQLQAQERAKGMLDRLAEKVARLEKEAELNKDTLQCALSDPQFGGLLRSAIMGAAQTSSAEKHAVLAALLTERLRVDGESIFAVASEVACETLQRCTSTQLKTLAFHASLTAITPDVCFRDFPSDEKRIAAFREWFDVRLAVLESSLPTTMDVQHLRAMGCLHTASKRLQPQSIAFRLLNTRKVAPRVGIQFEGPLSSFFGHHANLFERIWNNSFPLSGEILTPVGEMIGILTSDDRARAKPTDFSNWGRG